MYHRFLIHSSANGHLCCFHVLAIINSGEGNGNPLQYSCLENPVDGGAWKAAVHGVAEGQKRLSDFTFTFHFHALEKENGNPLQYSWASLMAQTVKNLVAMQETWV